MEHLAVSCAKIAHHCVEGAQSQIETLSRSMARSHFIHYSMSPLRSAGWDNGTPRYRFMYCWSVCQRATELHTHATVACHRCDLRVVITIHPAGISFIAGSGISQLLNCTCTLSLTHCFMSQCNLKKATGCCTHAVLHAPCSTTAVCPP